MKRLSGWDAMLLYGETPTVHMHTLKIAIIEIGDLGGREFGVAEFREVLGSRLYKLAPFGYQLIDIPWKFHRPMWRENCDVDLEYHIRPLTLPAPGGRRELDAAIGRIASTALDRRRPLWEMYLVDGLADGRIAVVAKIHHALADGVASANLMAQGMDLQPGSGAGSDAYTPDPPPSRTQLARTAFRDHLRQIGRVPATVRYTAEGVNRVRKSNRKLSPELTRPFAPPPSFINHALTSERRFATASLALADVKETSKHLGVSINDLVLAISAGALRKLMLQYDGTADSPLLASVPMSFDFSKERISGNFFTGVLMTIPVDSAEPLERVQRAHEAAVTAKESNNLIGPELISRWSNYMPPIAAESMFKWLDNHDGLSKMFNLNISNVPGPREHGRVGGALVTEIYSVGPLTSGSGVNITVWSYVDEFNISVITDGATVDDPHEITSAMLEEFIEIRRAAGLSGELSVIDKAMAQA